MARMMMTVIMSERSIGNLMRQKMVNSLAPSTRAASTGSVGRPRNPASMMMKTKAVCHQTSTRTMEGIAVSAAP